MSRKRRNNLARQIGAAVLLCLMQTVRAGNAPALDSLFEDVYFFGDLRLRGYYRDPAGASPTEPAAPWSAGSQLQLAARMQLTDRLGGLITGRWATQLAGTRDGQNHTARLGAYSWEAGTFALGHTELAVENIALLPLSIRAGRLPFDDGNGLLFSSKDGDWLLDGGLLSYEGARVNGCLLAARTAQNSPGTNLRQLLFLEAGHLAQRIWFARQHLYAGAFDMDDDAAPLLCGYRTTFYRDRLWEGQAELAMQGGRAPGNERLLAGIADAIILRRLPGEGLPGRGEAGWRWTVATGGQPDGPSNAFIPLLNHLDWGRVYNPELSNISILSAWLAWELNPAWLVEGRLYHYTQVRTMSAGMSNGRISGGGYQLPANGEARELGTEAGLRIQRKTAHVEIELLAGRFFRGSAYGGVPQNDNASEIRLQINWLF